MAIRICMKHAWLVAFTHHLTANRLTLPLCVDAFECNCQMQNITIVKTFN